jgi:hypothetical protein
LSRLAGQTILLDCCAKFLMPARTSLYMAKKNRVRTRLVSHVTDVASNTLLGSDVEHPGKNIYYATFGSLTQTTSRMRLEWY